MATLNIADITDGISGVVSVATTESGGIFVAQSEDEMTEGANVVTEGVALVQVYWSGFQKSPGGGTHHLTFGTDDNKPVYETQHRFNVDVLARQRSFLNLDLDAVAETTVAIDEAIEDEVSEPLFNVSGIKAFTYEAEFVRFTLGEGEDTQLFAGERFTLTVTLY